MRVTLLGHATILVETADLTVLTDPVLGDFLGGFAVPCPRRTIDAARLPEVDVLVLSHRHHDHLDVPSLARLRPRVNTVLCPDDPLVLEVLAALGYDEVKPVGPDHRVELGSTELAFTPSMVSVPEQGLLVTTPEGRIWNQVDTMLDLAWTPQLHRGGLRVDLHLANFCPILQNEVMGGEDTAFPLALYEELLEVVLAARARLAIPWAVGFALAGEAAWVNAHVFPVSHQRFISDLESAGFPGRAALLGPGDVIELRGSGSEPVVTRAARPELVRALDADLGPLRYRPSAGLPPLADTNPFGLAEESIWPLVERGLARAGQRLDEGFLGSAEERLRRWKATLAVTVSGRDRELHALIDFGAERPRLAEAPGAGDADLRVQITASGMAAMEGGTAWDRVLWECWRASSGLFRVGAGGHVTAPPRRTQGRTGSGQLPHAFDLFFGLWAPPERDYLMGEVRRALMGGSG